MNIYDLDPWFVKIIDSVTTKKVADIKEADGLMLLCPLCFQNNENLKVGVHSILLWQPHVPQEYSPTGGRWKFNGTGLSDLTLVAGSSSILLNGGCGAHFFIRNGQIEW